jgi:catechol 2,3-dioxygenase-like lactoylglutathione lyase family enzyme
MDTPSTPSPRITGWFPVLVSSDVDGSRRFYERHFGLVARFESDWYVQLGHPTNPSFEIGVMTMQHASLPAAAQTPAAGVLLSFEVADATAEYARLTDLGVELVHGLRDEAWGQRHFIIRGPDGVFVDVIEAIAPTEEYAAAYEGAKP